MGCLVVAFEGQGARFVFAGGGARRMGESRKKKYLIEKR